MKKVVLGMVMVVVILSGCSTTKKTFSDEQINSTTSSSNSDSSTHSSVAKSDYFKVSDPLYASDKKSFTIDVEVDPNTSVHVYNGDKRLKSVFSDQSGKAVLYLDTPAEKQTYIIKTDYAEKELDIKSLREFEEQKKAWEAEQATKESIENELSSKNGGSSQTKSTTSDSTQSEETSPESSSPTKTTTSSKETEPSQDKVSSSSKDQKSLLIAWTQLECEDAGAELSYQGSDAWNVAVNYVNGVNRWITTTQDKKYGRIKTIYEWSGNEDDGAVLIYLLINGNELINKM